MNRVVAGRIPVAVQAVVGIIAGAVFWTVVQVATPDIGHWLVNALALAPILAAAVAAIIHAKARRFTVFGWSFLAGTLVYGYLFSLLVLINL
ncbi:hypothetical protein [Nocardia sp. R6R-6]|uniref:hypothetical protein n=1 Tax=Nocardia sp. R6R-6 TaxID=3459303 RepID=UPI00403DB24C